MAEDIFQFFKEQAIPSAHLMGHSVGGKTAMEFALSYPKAVRKLVVVDISPRATLARHDTILEALAPLRLERFSSRESIDDALEEKIHDPAVRQFLLTNLKREEDGHYSWKMNLDALRRNSGAINRGIENGRQFNGPVLFLKGGKSPYITDDDTPVIKALFPQVEFQTIPKAGHWVHAEAPDEFLALVTRFISSS